MRLLSPSLAPSGEALLDLCRKHDYRDVDSRGRIRAAQEVFETEASRLLGIGDG